jgi:hypothetical protein
MVRSAAAPFTRIELSAAVGRLHDKCAVYTDSTFAPRVLDSSGWISSEDLTARRLLEPAAGDGALVALAAERLCVSAFSRGKDVELLTNAILAFEIEPGACAEARKNVVAVLVRHGVPLARARDLAKAWIRNADFLLQEPQLCSSVAANPPYVRWKDVPDPIKGRYERLGYSGVDLSLIFMAKSLEWLLPNGRAAFLCNDRWPYAVHGRSIREDMMKQARLLRHERIAPDVRTYARRVGAYGALSVLEKFGAATAVNIASGESGIRELAEVELGRLNARFASLAEAGCEVRVGPAFGHTAAFRVPFDQRMKFGHFVVPLVRGGDLRDERAILGEWVLFPVDDDGKTLSLSANVAMARRLRRFKAELELRACVISGTRRWFEPIDKLRWADVWDEKLLVAGIAKSARIVHDKGGVLPSNGVYMIRSKEWPYVALARVLRAGLLDLVCDAISPPLGGGTRRYHAAVLRRVPLPLWPSLDPRDQAALQDPAAPATAVRKALRSVLGLPERWYRGPAA